MGNNGEVFKLADNSMWEVKYEYSYLYAYNPTVTACPSQNQIIIDNKAINVALLSSNGGSIIEENIEGSFEGYKYEQLYKLTNGEIWQQTDSEYDYEYIYNPKVIIFSKNGKYMLKVQGMNQSVSVERLK